jgi:hypothetical protein
LSGKITSFVKTAHECRQTNKMFSLYLYMEECPKHKQNVQAMLSERIANAAKSPLMLSPTSESVPDAPASFRRLPKVSLMLRRAFANFRKCPLTLRRTFGDFRKCPLTLRRTFGDFRKLYRDFENTFANFRVTPKAFNMDNPVKA